MGGNSKDDDYMKWVRLNFEAHQMVSEALGRSGEYSLYDAFMNDSPRDVPEFLERVSELKGALVAVGLDLDEETFRGIGKSEHRYKHADVLDLLPIVGSSRSTDSEERQKAAKKIAKILKQCQ